MKMKIRKGCGRNPAIDAYRLENFWVQFHGLVARQRSNEMKSLAATPSRSMSFWAPSTDRGAFRSGSNRSLHADAHAAVPAIAAVRHPASHECPACHSWRGGYRRLRYPGELAASEDRPVRSPVTHGARPSGQQPIPSQVAAVPSGGHQLVDLSFRQVLALPVISVLGPTAANCRLFKSRGP